MFHFPLAYIDRVDRSKIAGNRKLQLFVNSSTSKSRFFKMSVIYIFGLFLSFFQVLKLSAISPMSHEDPLLFDTFAVGVVVFGTLGYQQEELCPTR